MQQLHTNMHLAVCCLKTHVHAGFNPNKEARSQTDVDLSSETSCLCNRSTSSDHFLLSSNQKKKNVTLKITIILTKKGPDVGQFKSLRSPSSCCCWAWRRTADLPLHLPSELRGLGITTVRLGINRFFLIFFCDCCQLTPPDWDLEVLTGAAVHLNWLNERKWWHLLLETPGLS